MVLYRKGFPEKKNFFLSRKMENNSKIATSYTKIISWAEELNTSPLLCVCVCVVAGEKFNVHICTWCISMIWTITEYIFLFRYFRATYATSLYNLWWLCSRTWVSVGKKKNSFFIFSYQVGNTNCWKKSKTHRNKIQNNKNSTKKLFKWINKRIFMLKMRKKKKK